MGSSCTSRARVGRVARGSCIVDLEGTWVASTGSSDAEARPRTRPHGSSATLTVSANLHLMRYSNSMLSRWSATGACCRAQGRIYRRKRHSIDDPRPRLRRIGHSSQRFEVMSVILSGFRRHANLQRHDSHPNACSVQLAAGARLPEIRCSLSGPTERLSSGHEKADGACSHPQHQHQARQRIDA